jgi:hypothetical protein
MQHWEIVVSQELINNCGLMTTKLFKKVQQK